MFGNDPKLGLHDIVTARFVIIASPVGSYYAEGLNPVAITIETEDVRAVRGGTGYAKCGGNYAASTRAGAKAEQKGFTQVLWLDGVERKYIEEVGAMNVMFKINGEVITPALTGSILPGITRKSCIELLKQRGIPVTERRLSVDELIDAMNSGTLEEAWGCGSGAARTGAPAPYFPRRRAAFLPNASPRSPAAATPSDLRAAKMPAARAGYLPSPGRRSRSGRWAAPAGLRRRTAPIGP